MDGALLLTILIILICCFFEQLKQCRDEFRVTKAEDELRKAKQENNRILAQLNGKKVILEVTTIGYEREMYK